MSTSSILVGSNACKIEAVVGALIECESSNLIIKNLANIGIKLGTPRENVVRLKRNYREDYKNLTDVVFELIEEWVCREADGATLQKLIQIFKEIGLNKFSVVLANKCGPGKDDTEDFKKYAKIPAELQRFLAGKPKFCILRTLDNKITCEKIEENLDNCFVYNWNDFLKQSSKSNYGNGNSLIVVRDCTGENLNQLNNTVFKIGHQGIHKIAFMSSANKQTKEDLLLWKEIFASKSPKLTVVNDLMEWDDLTFYFQSQVRQKLEELHNVKFIKEKLDGQLLVDLISHKEISLFKDTLPSELSYYIERTLQTRHFISSEIFSQTSEDIFLFTGIDRYMLSTMAKNKLTDTSTNQLQLANLNVKFMTLDQPNHFEIIVGISINPVHLLHYDNGRLKWAKSSKNLQAIQELVDWPQDEVHEAELFSNINLNSSQTVVIVDSPGMGKSVVLAKFGRRIKVEYPKRTVAFVIFNEFVRNYKQLEGDSCKENIISVLGKMLCHNPVGKALLANKLTSEEISVELLLDGFDEMDMSYFKLAYGILQTLSSIKAIRLWVTSRPHLLEELEVCLNVIGYNIKPFEEKHQIEFLSSYWSQDGQCSRSTLRDFAIECLKPFKFETYSREQDIAGVPLQCLLIAHVFEEEAKAHASSEQPLPQFVTINSITDLYKLLITKKMGKYISAHVQGNFCGTELLDMHARLSLQLIYPEYVKRIGDQLPPIHLADVLKLGILESCSTEIRPRFLHRTFAEYFVARFVVDRLASIDSWSETMTEFLFERVLLCRRAQEEYIDFNLEFECSYMHENTINDAEVKALPTFSHRIVLNNDRNESSIRPFSENYNLYDLSYKPKRREDKGFEFVFPVIARFIDSLLKIPPTTPPAFGLLTADFKAMTIKASHACVYHNFVNIFILIDRMQLFILPSNVSAIKRLVYLAIEHSEIDVIKLVLKLVEQHQGLELNGNNYGNILYHAVLIGKFSVVEFLIKEMGCRQIVKDYKKRGSIAGELLHACVKNTWLTSSALEIRERVQILRLLVGINQELLEVRNSNEETPLLTTNVHVALRIELVRLGADIFSRTVYGDTILHRFWQFSQEDYFIFLTSLKVEQISKLSRMKNWSGLTPLLNMLTNFDGINTTSEILTTRIFMKNIFWLKAHVKYFLRGDIKFCSFAASLVEHAYDNNWAEDNGTTLLHISAKAGNVEGVRFFAKQNAHQVNSYDLDGNTPLHCSLEMCKKEENLLEVITLLVNNGADANLVNKKEHTPFYISCYTMPVDISSAIFLKNITKIKWTNKLAHDFTVIICQQDINIVEKELQCFKQECAKHSVKLSLNYRDCHGNTLLHYAARHQFFNAIRFFVENKHIDINSINDKKQTVLHIAAQGGEGKELTWKIIQYLIEHGVDVYKINSNGNNFLHIYIRYFIEELQFKSRIFF